MDLDLILASRVIRRLAPVASAIGAKPALDSFAGRDRGRDVADLDPRDIGI